MKQDLLADALTIIKNAERSGKERCMVPVSKIVRAVLHVMQAEGYIGNFELVDDGKSGSFSVGLLKRINDCGVIKPNHSVKADGFERWEKRYLPAKGFGMLVVTTTDGIVKHSKAAEQRVGGRLMAYVY